MQDAAHDVVIVGAGPTGLMLAGELALAGVAVELLERRTTTELVGSRARGFHGRTIELLDQRGLAERFLAAGVQAQVLGFGSTPLDMSVLPSRHPYTLGIPQLAVERILLEWVTELGVDVRRGVEVTDVLADEGGVDVVLAGSEVVRAGYVVGTDGGRSVVRKAAGIDFVGAEPTRSHLIAEVAITEPASTGHRLDGLGIHALDVAEDGRTTRVVVTEQEVGTDEPTLADLRAAMVAAWGSDLGAHDPTWISRFTDATRQAVSYRSGRVLIAGDAAHTHPPVGGQGIGLGVADAVNLGWKLGLVVRGVAPDGLLDTYEAERHPATARVLDNVMTQAWLQRADARTDAMRRTFAEMLEPEAARERIAALLSGLDAGYDLGPGHPLLGRRMPDLTLSVTGRDVRVFELLHAARPVLLGLDGSVLDAGAWADRVRQVDASYAGEWVLPVVGEVPAPVAVLIRPDGHVAWVAEGAAQADGASLAEALERWYGPAA